MSVKIREWGMCTFGNGCMTAGYRRGIMQMVVGVGQRDSGTVQNMVTQSQKKILYLYIYIYKIYRYIDIEE